MAWQQFIVELDAADCAPAQDVLEASGAVAITYEDAGDDPVIEPAPGSVPLWPRTRLTALIDDNQDPSFLQSKLSEHLGLDVALPFRLKAVSERDWLTAWLDTAKPRLFGGHLWVLPTHAPAPADGLALRLDPGLAFGTGQHPTTALCLEWLAGERVAAKTLLDYGTGSGILAIAGCILGAEEAHATDIDPQALIASRQNAALNNVEDKITLCGPAALPERTWDIVIANIVSGPLIELADSIARYVCTGGRLALSGILGEQVASVSVAYARWFNFDPVQSADEWTLLSATRNATSA